MLLELSGALKAYRETGMGVMPMFDASGKPIGIAKKLADLLILVFDCCDEYGIDIANALISKVHYNATLPHRNNEKRC